VGTPRVPTPHASRFTVLALDAGEEILERGRVGRIAGEHLVGERQAFGSYHQRNNHLYAVGPMIA
jgi:hypothetical protein